MNRTLGALLKNRAVFLGLALLLTAGISCRSKSAIQRQTQPSQAANPAAGTQKTVTPGTLTAGAVKPVPPAKPEAAPASGTQGPGDPASAGVKAGEGGPDKDVLWQCYQEVYCAQKKGEMDRILDIYKKHGFETPQEFTRAWIEAAKDTDWVSKLAHDVSKKCR